MQSVIRRMGWWQFHRGPDGWGEWFGSGVGLGHNRLAILDLAGGAQPMAAPDGRIQVVFNGEIYNFRALWDELSAKGHKFQTDHSDTEVIVHGYREWGTDVFARLEGMFAIGIWDNEQKRLVLGRDSLGIKPLYYACTAAGLVFASEPKTILASGWAPRELNTHALADFFMFRAPLAPATLFRGISKLPSGTWCGYTAAGGVGPTHRYWHPPGRESCIGPPDSSPESIERAIEDALVSHLVSDVPVGLFLSGGVDSSLLGALATKHASIDGFTVGTNSPLDESGFASQVGRHLGVPVHVRRVTGDDFRARFDDWCFVNDDPVADPSALALMLLAEHAQTLGMKVMIAGEGADELFGGYASYVRYRLYSAAGHVPLMYHVARLLGALPFARARDRDYLNSLQQVRFRGSAHVLHGTDRHALFTGATAASIDNWAATAFTERLDGYGAARSAMVFDQSVRLPNDLLPRTDRATMAHSIEARVPFLDRRVVELANGLSDRACVRIMPPARKVLLKRIAAGKVPRSTVYRKKRGFNLPVEAWLSQDFSERITSFLGEQAIGELDYAFLRTVYRDHVAGRHRADLLWAWLVLEEWYRLWIKGDAIRREPPVISDRSAAALLRQAAAAP
jgi:asparagine synthase (glutamine-hydrolysing)